MNSRRKGFRRETIESRKGGVTMVKTAIFFGKLSSYSPQISWKEKPKLEWSFHERGDQVKGGKGEKEDLLISEKSQKHKSCQSQGGDKQGEREKEGEMADYLKNAETSMMFPSGKRSHSLKECKFLAHDEKMGVLREEKKKKQGGKEERTTRSIAFEKE